MKIRRIALLAVLFVVLIGCQQGSKFERMAPTPQEISVNRPAGATTPTLAATQQAGFAGDQLAAKEEANKDAAGQLPPLDAATRGRKLIRNGEVGLRVRDLEASRAKLEEMTRAAGGFVADVRFDRGDLSSEIQMTLRLPAEGFAPFIKSLAALGVIEKEATATEDVTDQWVDLNRRIETDEKLAARLESLIENKSYQFKDLLDVERELARLRLDIERLQGSLRGMDDRIALSTLKVTMRQEVLQKIAPPDSVFAPLLNALENAGPHMKGSVHAMMSFAGGLISLIMVLLPWLIVLGVLLSLVIFIARRRKHRGR